MDDATLGQSFDEAALTQASDVLERAIAAGDLAGGVTLVWRKGEIVHFDAQGRRNLETGAPMTRDTLFRIASMTKPVTTLAAMLLVEEGKLALDDPITRWAPEFADMQVLRDATGPLGDVYDAPREITVEDLMTHRAGLAYGFGSLGPIAHAYDRAFGDLLDVTLSPDEWMAAQGALPLSYPPGERFHYSHATDVLGFLVGRVAGQDIRTFLIERIFGPLGMSDTDFYIPPEKRGRAAVVYRQDEESGALSPVAFRQHDTPPVYCGGGGGLISTAEDYLKFARLMLGGGAVDGIRLLRPETVEIMRTNRLTDRQRQIPFLGLPFWITQGFGLGVSMILDPTVHAMMGAGSKGAFGWPGAFGTWWQADPQEDMILIYLIQNSIELGPEAVANMGASRRLGARLALPMWQKAVYAGLRA